MTFAERFKSLFQTKSQGSLESILRNIAGLFQTVSGIAVTPENCMQSPTVRAIVTAVSNRISVSPIHIYRKTTSQGRDSKEELPNHPVARLLRAPSQTQTTVEYWTEATSSLLRYGRFFAYKGQGSTGPIRFLDSLPAGQMDILQDQGSRAVTFRYAGQTIYQPYEIHYARLSARDFLRGDSPVEDIRESIGLEIAAERFGASFFGNGAMPLIYFSIAENMKDFKTTEEKELFLKTVKEAFGGNKKFSTMMLPKGINLDTLALDNDKAQFIETRRFIRTVIAGAFGVPPHLVGDLERATFNNVEQQDSDFVLNVVLPIAKLFEAAMERDLLTDEDRRSNVVIRFNLDAILRADFKSRQEGLQIQRQNGAISANEWREKEGMNPISKDDGGDEYIRPANMTLAGQPPPGAANANATPNAGDTPGMVRSLHPGRPR